MIHFVFCRKTLDNLLFLFSFVVVVVVVVGISSILFLDSSGDMAGIESFFAQVFAALTLCGGSLSIYSDWDETIFPQRFC